MYEITTVKMWVWWSCFRCL